MPNSTRSYIFTTQGYNVSGVQNAAIHISEWTGEIDCARQSIAAGGMSFSYQQESNACLVFQYFTGSHERVFYSVN